MSNQQNLLRGNPATQWQPGISGNPKGRAPSPTIFTPVMVSPWTEEIVEALREKWSYGKSCTVISRELNSQFGTKFTRNAVIGKVDRINLPKRVSVIRALFGRAQGTRKRHEPKPPKSPKVKLPTFYQARALADQEIPQAQRKTFFELGAHDCRFPVGEPGSADFFFCGGQAEDSQPYCTGHCVRAFIPDKRKLAAA